MNRREYIPQRRNAFINYGRCFLCPDYMDTPASFETIDARFSSQFLLCHPLNHRNDRSLFKADGSMVRVKPQVKLHVRE